MAENNGSTIADVVRICRKLEEVTPGLKNPMKKTVTNSVTKYYDKYVKNAHKLAHLLHPVYADMYIIKCVDLLFNYFYMQEKKHS